MPLGIGGARGTMADDPIRYWQSLTTGDVAQVIAQDPVLVLPLAAIEQHGAHLPLSTDVDIGLGLLAAAFRRLPADCPAWVLPVQAIGASLEHLRFPGTLSLSPEHLGAVLQDVGRALAGSGVRRLVLSNSHGGNRAAIASAALQLREEWGLLVIKTHYGFFARPSHVELPESEWRHGLHGGAVETAMMLHLQPERVRRDAMAAAASFGLELEAQGRHLTAEDEGASFAWLAGDLHPSGITGNPTLATAEMGRRLVEGYGATLAEVIRDAHAFPLDRLG